MENYLKPIWNELEIVLFENWHEMLIRCLDVNQISVNYFDLKRFIENASEVRWIINVSRLCGRFDFEAICSHQMRRYSSFLFVTHILCNLSRCLIGFSKKKVP